MKWLACFLTGMLGLISLEINAQSFWQKIYGGEATDEGNAILITNDGRLLIGGSSESFNAAGDREAYMAKLELDGSLIWEKTYNWNSFWNPIYDFVETSTGNIVAVGSTWAGLCSNGQAYIVECSPTGDTIWSKGICANQYAFTQPAAMVITPDGGYAVAGMGNYTDNVVYKLNSQGDIEWESAIINPGWESTLNLILTQDSNLVFASYWAEEINGNNDAFLAKLSLQTGDTIWTRRIPLVGSSEYFNDVLETANGDLIAVGNIGQNFILSQFSGTGALLEQRVYTDTSLTWFHPTVIEQTADGGFIIAGYIYNLDRDGFLVKLSPNFDLEWYQTFGGSGEDIFGDMVILPDGGFCIIGQTKSFGDVLGDVWVLRTDSLGNTVVKTILGSTFIDGNMNCLKDPSEQAMPNAWIEVDNGNQHLTRLTNSAGQYTALVNDGDFQVSATPPLPYWEICNTPQQAQISSQSPMDTLDFGAQAVVDCPHINLDMSMPFLRLCDDGKIYGRICNDGTIPALDTKVSILLDTFLTLDSATVPFVANGNNSFLFDTGNLGLFECLDFKLYVNTDCAAPLGWLHCLEAEATPDTICHPAVSPSNSSITECILNVGSYDPNDKTAYPPGQGEAHIIEKDTEIKYQIRFQNTGTDTAFSVVVVDTISELLDARSFRQGASSHAYRVEWGNDNAVKFIFDPIVLPDSIVDEPASHGFVNFFITPKFGLLSNTVIENKADIYFDQNAPVTTNTWFHTIGNIIDEVTSTFEKAGITVRPNPTNDFLNIQVPDNYLNGSVHLYDAFGRSLRAAILNAADMKWDVSNLPSGVYYVVFKSYKTTITQPVSIIR
jgi:hypothetical protein